EDRLLARTGPGTGVRGGGAAIGGWPAVGERGSAVGERGSAVRERGSAVGERGPAVRGYLGASATVPGAHRRRSSVRRGGGQAADADLLRGHARGAVGVGGALGRRMR